MKKMIIIDYTHILQQDMISSMLLREYLTLYIILLSLCSTLFSHFRILTKRS